MPSSGAIILGETSGRRRGGYAWRSGAVAALVAAVAGEASAQMSGPLEAAVLVAPSSTRGLGMGDAFVLGATDPDAIFANAALGAQLRGMSLGVSRFGGDAEGALGFTAAAGTAWWRGAVGVGLRVSGRNAGGSPGAGAAASLAYAVTVLGVRLAAGASLLEQSWAGGRGSGVSFDAAAATNVGPFYLGASARNLGPDVTLRGEGAAAATLSLPERFVANAATRTLVAGPLDVIGAAAWATDADGEWTAGAGVETAYWPIQGRTFAVRAGVRRGREHAARLTLGAGFRGDALGIDWGWLDAEGGVHRVGVSWR